MRGNLTELNNKLYVVQSGYCAHKSKSKTSFRSIGNVVNSRAVYSLVSYLIQNVLVKNGVNNQSDPM